MMKKTVTIIDNITGKKIECPLYQGTYGPLVIDTQALYQELGMFTLDPGFVTTASCRSAITYLDGEEGILLYRGYPIEQLAEQSTYLEVCYLLLYGELPTADQMLGFEEAIKGRQLVHEHLTQFYTGYRYDAHPMSIMVGITGALSSYYHEALDIHDPDDRDLTAKRIIAKMPTIAAQCHKHSLGHPFVYPDNSLGYVENFMNMMFSVPVRPYELHPKAVRALDLLLILHADHEQNCSTSTVRLVGSSHANLFASVAAGVYALWGPQHGGANQKVIEMLERIRADDGNVRKYLEMARDKNNPFRLFGFGHRVYKNYDPRALILKKACDEVLGTLGTQDPLVDIAKQIEEIALQDDFFLSKKLYPNVDFYSGIIYKAIGFPVNMFTVLFAMGRLPGWIAHWREMMADPKVKIGRPRQIYTGPTQREYVAIEAR